MSKTGFCENCGAALLPNARFCEECGTPVTTTLFLGGSPAAAPPAERPVTTGGPKEPTAGAIVRPFNRTLLIFGFLGAAALVLVVAVGAIIAQSFFQGRRAGPGQFEVVTPILVAEVATPIAATSTEPAAPSPTTVTVETPLPIPTAVPTEQTATQEPTATATLASTPTGTRTTRAASSTQAAAPGVYVTALRVSPAKPKPGEGITFFASFLNTTGTIKSYRWRVEIWKPEETKNSFGITNGRLQDIPIGSKEMDTVGNYKMGPGSCSPFRARAIWEDEAQHRTPFMRPSGSELWLDFQVCQ